MITVFFYNLILLGSTFCVWLSERGKGNLERYFFLGMAFFMVFVPAAIRYDVGTDYFNYVDIFEDSNRLEGYKYKEPLFYFVNWFYQSVGAHSQWIFATFAFIFTAVAFKAYPRKKAWMLHYAFFSMLWFFSFNGVRQAIAVAFVFLALSYYFKQQRAWFFVLVLIGGLFHQSVLPVAFVGLFSMIPLGITIKGKLAPAVFIGCILLTFFFVMIVIGHVELFVNLFGFEQYAKHFANKAHFSERDFGTGFGILISLVFSVYILLRSDSILRANNGGWLLILLVFLYAIVLILAGKIIIFERALVVFFVAPVFSIYVLLYMPRSNLLDKIVCAAFLSFLMLSFLKNSMGLESSYSNPKRNPYKSVLSIDGVSW